MNAIPKSSEQCGSTFLDLTVGENFVIQGTQVYFDLVQMAYGKVTSSISAVIEANETQGYSFWNNTSDPQNDDEFNFDKLEVDGFNIARVKNVDDVLAVEGQPFFLTESQCKALNEKLNEFFEEQKVEEFKRIAACTVENLA